MYVLRLQQDFGTGCMSKHNIKLRLHSLFLVIIGLFSVRTCPSIVETGLSYLSRNGPHRIEVHGHTTKAQLPLFLESHLNLFLNRIFGGLSSQIWI